MWLVVAALALTPYWRDPRIHNLGNVGVGGAVHALIAPFATHMIDRAAYGGVDVRALVLREHVAPGDDVVDLGCGTGFSTAAVGVDTSEEMLAVARRVHPAKRFVQGNAETWGGADAADVVTMMFLLHEAPRPARGRLLSNAMRVARRKVVVADILPSYEPSDLMLSGEPYVLDYLAHVDADVDRAARRRRWTVEYTQCVGRVGVWILRPQTSSKMRARHSPDGDGDRGRASARSSPCGLHGG
jgi:SAM-dependent methyltransferase